MTKTTNRLNIGYEEMSAELGVTRQQLQSFVKRQQKVDPQFGEPDGQTIRGKALTHVFTRVSADVIIKAWQTIGPGRKK